MKFMFNVIFIFGIYDGVNIEIVKVSGEENNYIFGLRVEDIEKIKYSYNFKWYYRENLSIKRVVDVLINGILNDGGYGYFEDLYNVLLEERD